MRLLWYVFTFPGQLARIAALPGGGTWAVMGSPFGVLMSTAAFYFIGYLLFFAPGA